MKIVYDERVDGLSIVFSDVKPNRDIEVTPDVTLYLRDDRLVLMDVRRASLQGDVSEVVHRYVPKGTPFDLTVEVDRDGDE